MDSIYDIFKKITEIAIGIAALSFIFYSMGVLNILGYLSALNISRYFFEYNYQDYILNGILSNFIFLGYIPILMEWYLDYSFIINTETQISESDHKKKDELLVKINNVKLRFSSRNILKSFNKSSLVILLFSLPLAGFFYFIYKVSSITFIVLQFIIGLIVALILFNLIRRHIEGKKRLHLQTVGLFIIIIIVVMPALSGYLEGLSRIKENDFIKMDIVTRNETIKNIGFVISGKGMYVFRQNNENLYIPESEIIKMHSIK